MRIRGRKIAPAKPSRHVAVVRTIPRDSDTTATAKAGAERVQSSPQGLTFVLLKPPHAGQEGLELLPGGERAA